MSTYLYCIFWLYIQIVAKQELQKTVRTQMGYNDICQNKEYPLISFFRIMSILNTGRELTGKPLKWRLNQAVFVIHRGLWECSDKTLEAFKATPANPRAPLHIPFENCLLP